MRKLHWIIAGGFAVAAAAWLGAAAKIDAAHLLVGQSAFLDYRAEKPGNFRKITMADLPKPYETKSSSNGPSLVPRPSDAWPQAPAGFKVDLYVSGLNEPREIRTAPNGDFFVAESSRGEIKIFRGVTKDGKPEESSVFATGLRQPFGIAFYPA